MECNKEEAFKAMQIAEKKLQNNEFMGARKMAQTAQRLYPTLENISQLLTVCEIHCSAQNRICGSDNDWYEILQIEQSADETTIKKQYRKLALLLHPDKNKFSGAEAAFKLVGEANRVLSDQAKRKLYDMKYTAATRNAALPKPSHNQPNGYTAVKQEGGVANGYTSGPYSQFSGRSSYTSQQQAFWTCCPFCSVRYQYLKCYLSKMLRCQNCGRGFISYDLKEQIVPPTSHQSHSPQKKVVSESGPSKSAAHSKRGSDKKSKEKFAGVDRASGESNTSRNNSSAKAGKKQKVRRANVKDDQRGSVKPKPDAEMADREEKSGSDAATTKEQEASKSKKRQRKSAVRSGEDCENGSEDEGDVLSENNPIPSRDNCHRRSSRHKEHVSYKKFLGENDDDLGCSSKKSSNAQTTDCEENLKGATRDVAASKVDNSSECHGSVDGNNKGNKCEVTAPLSESLPNKKPKIEEVNVMRDGPNMSDQNNKKSKEGTDACTKDVPGVQIVDCADPEFSNFDKDKMGNCFAVNQVWAIYDTVDGMPRFYARIKKVFSPGFKLQITWFEPDPDDEDEIDWFDADLPVACGKYALGSTEETVDLPMFSHLVHGLKRGPRGVYSMYPKKGETWALFKDWDIRWRFDAEKHVPYKYEFVEILSDYVEDAGISVAYLDKVKGFVCLFHRSNVHGLNSLQIPPNELYRFSHRVPSFRMTGNEREGVPKGSFELDPASLPLNINDHGDSDDVKMETGDVASGRNDASCDCKFPKNKVEVIGPENIQPANMQNRSDPKSEASILRRSPRKFTHKNDSQVNTDQHMTEDNASKDATHNGFSTQKESVAIHANGGLNTPKKHDKNGIERETVILRRSPRDVSKKNAG